MNKITQSTVKNVLKNDEQILVVKTSKILKNYWQGLKTNNLDEVISTIKSEKEFQLRSLMEQDPSFKQIIPYIVFKHKDWYFVMQRKASASEQRLKSKFSLGIGGHVREEDMRDGDIENWSIREFNEEVSYNGKLNVKLVGLLNDDSNDVGKVHMGMVFILEGDNDQIRVKSELKSGVLIKKDDLKNYFDSMESWSQIVTKYIFSEC